MILLCITDSRSRPVLVPSFRKIGTDGVVTLYRVEFVPYGGSRPTHRDVGESRGRRIRLGSSEREGRTQDGSSKGGVLGGHHDDTDSGEDLQKMSYSSSERNFSSKLRLVLEDKKVIGKQKSCYFISKLL